MPARNRQAITENDLLVISRHTVWAYNTSQHMNKYVALGNTPITRSNKNNVERYQNMARMFMSYWLMTLYEIQNYKDGALCSGLRELNGIKTDLFKIRQSAAHVLNLSAVYEAFENLTGDTENKMEKFKAAHDAIIAKVFELAAPYPYIVQYLNRQIPIEGRG